LKAKAREEQSRASQFESESKRRAEQSRASQFESESKRRAEQSGMFESMAIWKLEQEGTP
jgi:hypothetical protein